MEGRREGREGGREGRRKGNRQEDVQLIFFTAYTDVVKIILG